MSKASSPRQSVRNSGIAKNIPIITRYCMSRTDRPVVRRRLANSAGSTSGDSRRATRRRCHATNASSRISPPATSQVTAERPSSDGVASGPSGTRGRTQPHVPDCRTPNTKSPSPAAERTAPTKSRRGRSSVGTSRMMRDDSRMAAAIRTSAAKTQRQVKYAVTNPPIRGPSAIATAAAAAIVP